jgi:hypothetical protein
MRLRVTSTDYSPEELDRAVPFELRLLRQLPGQDRHDYWLSELNSPIAIAIHGQQRDVTHFIVTARWQRTRIAPKVENLPINLAAVVDMSQLTDSSVSFSKNEFIAIGVASEVDDAGEPKPITSILSGTIGAFFGKGTHEQ